MNPIMTQHDNIINKQVKLMSNLYNMKLTDPVKKLGI